MPRSPTRSKSRRSRKSKRQAQRKYRALKAITDADLLKEFDRSEDDSTRIVAKLVRSLADGSDKLWKRLKDLQEFAQEQRRKIAAGTADMAGLAKALAYIEHELAQTEAMTTNWVPGAPAKPTDMSQDWTKTATVNGSNVALPLPDARVTS